MSPKGNAVSILILAALHIFMIVMTITTHWYERIPRELTFRLDRVFSTGTGGPADMIVLYLIGAVFYCGYLVLLSRPKQRDHSWSILVVVLAALILNSVLISFVRVGGDVVRNISFAAAFTKGYNPYAITGYQLNELIRGGKVDAPFVQEYLDHRLDYPPITLLYYSGVLILGGSLSRAYILTEVGLTAVRFAGAFLVYKICRSHSVPYWVPVGLYLMNPVMIYASYDGKEEALFIALSLLSIYFYGLLNQRGTALSGISLGLSTLAKYVSFVYWPVMALHTRRVKLSLFLTAAYFGCLLIASLPFLLNSPYVFAYVFWQISRPCNSLLNLFCYDAAHPFSAIRFAAGLGYLGIFALLTISYRSEQGLFRMTTMLTAVTILAIIFSHSFFIWYLDWLSISIYFAQRKRTFHYLLPVILPLIALPSLFG